MCLGEFFDVFFCSFYSVQSISHFLVEKCIAIYLIVLNFFILLQMIIEAITSLKERTGSSHPAIAKHIEAKHKTNLPGNFKKLLYVQLKKLVEKKKLLQIKNSYKLPVVAKKKPSTASVLKKKPSKPSTKKVKPIVKPKKASVSSSAGTHKPKPKRAVSEKKVVAKKVAVVKKAPAVKKAVAPPAKKATVAKKAPVVKKVAAVKKTTVVKKAVAVKKVAAPAKKKAPVKKAVASPSLKKKKVVAKPPAKKVKASA